MAASLDPGCNSPNLRTALSWLIILDHAREVDLSNPQSINLQSLGIRTPLSFTVPFSICSQLFCLDPRSSILPRRVSFSGPSARPATRRCRSSGTVRPPRKSPLLPSPLPARHVGLIWLVTTEICPIAKRPRRSWTALAARILYLPPWIRSSCSSGSRRISRDTSISLASAPHLHRRTIIILTAVPFSNLHR